MNTDMKSNCCLACKGRLKETPLLTLEGMPASAQDIPDSNQVKQDQGITLNLHQCPHCGLVQFDCQPVEYYRDVIRSGGTDAGAIHQTRRGVYTGGISIPCRYTHSPMEMVDRRDVEACAALVAAFAQDGGLSR